MRTEFGLLGSLLVRQGDSVLPVSHGKQRILLAALLLNANRPVSSAELAEILWEGTDGPPATARVTLQNYVRRLRIALRATGADRIGTTSDGYQIHVDAGELDVTRFAELAASSQKAAAGLAWDVAERHASAALALWRGEPLADVPAECLVSREVPRLTEARIQVVETRMDAALELGRHAEILGELRELVDRHPLREHLHAQLMLALARSGRRADALAAYQDARRLLDDELGVPPGPELRQVQQRVLTGELRSAERRSRPGAVVPHQLPVAVRHFTGREKELSALSDLVGGMAETGGTAVISAIGGTAGIGKTALAVEWAHRHVDRFPDGQLYVNLRGFDPGGVPVDRAVAVHRFLEALGVAPNRLPSGLDAQLDLYRSMVAERRMLVVLDNARDTDHVRPLLPGAGCVVVVTSRNQLSGLVAMDGAVPLNLDLLAPPEARDLMVRRLGAGRVAAEADAVDELVDLCAHLPLALNIVAARAALRPSRPLAALVDELRHTRARLDVLTTDDVTADVRTVFSWSYQTLDPAAARMFRLLGVHPGPDITAAAAASLAATTERRARQALDDLARAHLVAEPVPGRYTCHDLLRSYATELAATHDTEPDRRAALCRALDHYLRTGTKAMLTANPDLSYVVRLPDPAPGVTAERIDDVDRALSWLDAEFSVLAAATGPAGSAGFGTHAWQLAWVLVMYLHRKRAWRAERMIGEQALAAARECGDLAGQAWCHHWLGNALVRLRSPEAGDENLRASLALFVELGEPTEQARVHLDLGLALSKQGRYAEAIDHARQATELFRSVGDDMGAGRALNNLGWHYLEDGRPERTLDCCGRALVLARQTDDRITQAAALDSLGGVHQRLGGHDVAAEHYRQSLDVLRLMGYRYYEAGVLRHLGECHAANGDRAAAAEAWQEALRIYVDLDHPDADLLRAELADLD